MSAPYSRRVHVPLHRGRKHEDGRRLCCHCATPLEGRRRDWCSDECAQRYMIRTGDQGAARRFLFARDVGVCALCKTDTRAVLRELLHRHRDGNYRHGSVEQIPTVGEWQRARWEADHTVPLVEGGSRDPENLRTLCRPCHKCQTAALAARRAEARRLAGQSQMEHD